MTVAACRALVERGDPDRFIVTRAASDAAQAMLWPLYAFNLEVVRAPWVTAEPLIAHMRLQWWHDTLAGIGAGEPPRAHEVAGPLAQVIRSANLPLAPLDALIAARAWDIGHEPFADAAALAAHIDATAGTLMWSAALALGAGPAAEPVVRDFALGAGLANWLRAVPALLARGCRPLPERGGVADLARLGLARIGAARVRRGLVARAATPALLTGWQATAILRLAARDPGRVAAGRLAQPEFARRGTLLWRAASGLW